MNIPWLPFSRTAVLWIALSLALVLMLVGHWAVMSSGAIFDPSTGAGFGITTQWVSDYAASGRQGLWIKFAIVAFCFALVEFFAAQIRSSTTRRLRAWWGVLGLAMIVGLLLVAVFDQPPPRWVRDAGMIDVALGRPGQWVMTDWTAQEWKSIWFHNHGFLLFVGTFLVAAISLAVVEYRRDGRWGVSAMLLILPLLCYLWLCPLLQRALLVAITAWLVRNYLRTRRPVRTSA